MSKRLLKYHIYTGIIHKVLFLTSHKYISYVTAKFFVIYNGLFGNYSFFFIEDFRDLQSYSLWKLKVLVKIHAVV
jgi:hypothetical protein